MRTRMMIVLSVLSCLCMTRHGFCADPGGGFRVWTSHVGSTLNARFVEMKLDIVTLESRDGRVVKLHINKLSPADQLTARRLASSHSQPNSPAEPAPATAPCMLDLKVRRSKKTRKDGSDFDNTSQSISLTITLKSRELTMRHTGLTARVYVLAENVVRPNYYKLIVKEKYRVDLDLGATHIHKTETVDLRFDDSNWAQFGHKYTGYVYILKNPNGAILLQRTSPKKFEKPTTLKKLLKAKYDEEVRL